MQAMHSNKLRICWSGRRPDDNVLLSARYTTISWEGGLQFLEAGIGEGSVQTNSVSNWLWMTRFTVGSCGMFYLCIPICMFY